MRQLDSVKAVCAQPRNAMTIASGVEDRKVVPLAAVRDQRRFAAELSEFDQSLAARDQSRSRVRLAPRPRILARSYSEACRRLLTASHQEAPSLLLRRHVEAELSRISRAAIAAAGTLSDTASARDDDRWISIIDVSCSDPKRARGCTGSGRCDECRSA